MKSYLSLAFRELKAQKVMASLILTAVILSSTMTTAIGHSLGILKTLQTEQAASLNGDRYASFHQITEAQMLQLKNDSRLSDVGSGEYPAWQQRTDSVRARISGPRIRRLSCDR